MYSITEQSLPLNGAQLFPNFVSHLERLTIWYRIYNWWNNSFFIYWQRWGGDQQDSEGILWKNADCLGQWWHAEQTMQSDWLISVCQVRQRGFIFSLINLFALNLCIKQIHFCATYNFTVFFSEWFVLPLPFSLFLIARQLTRREAWYLDHGWVILVARTSAIQWLTFQALIILGWVLGLVTIPWLVDIASLNKPSSIRLASCRIVMRDPSLRYTLSVAGR